MILIFRTDANVAIGTGHVMRCIALAQAWEDAGGQSIFAMSQATEAVRRRLLAEKFEVVIVKADSGSRNDAQQLAELALQRQAGRVVVDGYAFDAGYQSALKAAGLKMLFIDDYGHAQHYAADLVLNQNPGAADSLYHSREPHTRLLLGARYALLRREFRSRDGWQREIAPNARRVLITMGGSDPENFTERAIRALSRVQIDGVEAIAVIGGSNPHADALQRLGQEFGGRVSIRRDVSDMAELMDWAEVAISAAGSTCWEICLLGLPALLVDLAENQRGVAEELHRRGCAIHLGSLRAVSEELIAERLQWLLNSAETRRALSLRGQQLVDGKGAARVVSMLRSGNYRLRRASEQDCRLLWEWANDPEVRASSFSPNAIPWPTHVAWFAERLNRSLILIAEDEQATPLGQVRFDAQPEGDWEVDVSVARPLRGRGLASGLIESGVGEILKQNRGARIHAYVKPANLASVRAFERAGFRSAGTDQVRGNAAIHLVYAGN